MPRSTATTTRASRSFCKLGLRSYYSSARSSGYPEVAWAKVTAPAALLGVRDAGTVDLTTRASEAAQ